MGAPSRQAKKIARIVFVYNQLINVFWSGINFAPIGYYGYFYMDRFWLSLFLILSGLPAFLPKPFFDRIQLSRTTEIYQRLGIRTVKKYTQDGDLIKRWIRSRFPQDAPAGTMPIRQYLGRTYMYEKFHYIALLFFLLTSFYAFFRQQGWWGTVITLNNLIFNVYPIFLQQYNRIRFRQAMQRRALPRTANR